MNTQTADRAFLGHPKGLAVLAFTEAWERFSFYGMQTLLVLYMVDKLLAPGTEGNVLGLGALRGGLESMMGPLGGQAFASMIFGLYSGLAYFLPVFGGLIGDRWAGQHAMVTTGAVLMAAGHLLMAFAAPFLIALGLLIVGSGCLKGNISTQVGSLYAPGDRRRTEAFQIFAFGINIGAVAAPLLCGTLGEIYGWHYGFGLAGVGMVIGLVIYLAGRKYLPPDLRPDLRKLRATTARAPLTREEWKVIGALIFVLLIITLYLTPGGQLGNTYPLWVRSHVDRHVGHFVIPVTWFLSFTAIASLFLPPMILRLWRFQAERGREPDEIGKLRVGLALATITYALLAILAWVIGDGISWLWLILYHCLFALAYLFIWPVGMSLFARAAPPGVNAMFIGIFYTSVFFANNLVGIIGGFYSRMSPPAFWGLQVVIGLAGFLLIALFGAPIRRIVRPRPLATIS